MAVLSSIVCLLAIPVIADNEITTVPEHMNPNSIIKYDDNMEIDIIESGLTNTYKNQRTFSILPANIANTITLSENLDSYSEDELSIINQINNTNASVTTVNDDVITAAPGMVVVYDGQGTIYKVIYEDNNTLYNSVALAWTYPANGTYQYGTTVNNWITLTSEYVMGQGNISYFTDQYGCHSDDLNQMESDDADILICATKMDYDRPARGQKIKLRVLDSNYEDTSDIYYLNKYDIGGLPNAVIDGRPRLAEKVLGSNYSYYGVFNGRYFYYKDGRDFS